jgi:8-amino-7-oxononanoate synthase
MRSITDRIQNFLREREEGGRYRRLRAIRKRESGRVLVDNRWLIDLSSNDYLGLSDHFKLKEAAKEAAERYGTSSSASRLLSGNLTIHQELEVKVAEFAKRESALLFSSGYLANIGTIPTLCGKEDAIFADRLSHASIIDGSILSGARLFRFSHNDPEHLELLLKKHRANFKEALIVTESVFSMEGDIAPLKELCELKERFSCILMVDEAHSFGVFGNGTGLCEGLGVDIIMATFGKALGGAGAFIACSQVLKEYLINRARTFIYSTALPPSVVAVNIVGLEIVKEEPERRKILLCNAEKIRSELKKRGFSVRGKSQIIPMVFSSEEETIKEAERLQKKGLWVLPIRPPTVPKGECRIRLSLSFSHTNMLDRIVLDLTNQP